MAEQRHGFLRSIRDGPGLPLFLIMPGLLTAPLQSSSAGAEEVHPALVIPFVLLLVSIAILPLISRKWWAKYYPAVSIGLGAFTAVYCIFQLHLVGYGPLDVPKLTQI